jgi:ABC-type sugar transport system ATPase subunit
MERFSVRAPNIDALIQTLSGGNQQKVVLARALERNPVLVVLSEPTRGIDVGAKSEIYGLIRDMADAGAAIVVVSSELPEVLAVSHRVLVMFRGEMRAELDASAATEDRIAHIALGGEHV